MNFYFMSIKDSRQFTMDLNKIYDTVLKQHYVHFSTFIIFFQNPEDGTSTYNRLNDRSAIA